MSIIQCPTLDIYVDLCQAIGCTIYDWRPCPAPDVARSGQDMPLSLLKGYEMQDRRPLVGVQAIAQERKSEAIVRQMRAMIETNRILPGNRLPSEPLLAESFSVSRTVIREAVRVLETQGVIEVRRGANGGTFVTERIPEEFRPAQSVIGAFHVDQSKLRDARLCIETGLIRTSLRPTPRDLLALRENLALSSNPATTPARLAIAFTDFHIAVGQMSDNTILSTFLAQLTQPIRTAIGSKVADADWCVECQRQHGEIVRAIDIGDKDHAADLMRAHIRFEQGEDS